MAIGAVGLRGSLYRQLGAEPGAGVAAGGDTPVRMMRDKFQWRGLPALRNLRLPLLSFFPLFLGAERSKSSIRLFCCSHANAGGDK